MSETTVFVIISLLILASSIQVSSYIYVMPSTEQNGMCKGQDGNLHNIGSNWYYKRNCERATCVEDNNQVHEEVLGCGIASAAGNCRVVPKRKGLYPYCCPKLVCD